ncbi:hypothetical protein [Methylomagnum sp.]
MRPKTLAILAVRRNPSGDVGLLMGYGAPLPFQNSGGSSWRTSTHPIGHRFQI